MYNLYTTLNFKIRICQFDNLVITDDVPSLLMQILTSSILVHYIILGPYL